MIIYGILLEKEKDNNIENNSKDYYKHDHLNFLAFSLLILTPVLASLNSILVRKLRKINENTLCCYTNTCSVVVMYTLLKMNDMDTSFIVRIIKT